MVKNSTCPRRCCQVMRVEFSEAPLNLLADDAEKLRRVMALLCVGPENRGELLWSEKFQKHGIRLKMSADSVKQLGRLLSGCCIGPQDAREPLRIQRPHHLLVANEVLLHRLK